MVEFLTNTNVDWQLDNIIFDVVNCKRNDTFLDFVEILSLLDNLKEWTPDVTFTVIAHISEKSGYMLDIYEDVDYIFSEEVEIPQSAYNNMVIITKEAYKEMEKSTKRRLKRFCLKNATRMNFSDIDKYNVMCPEKKAYFLEQCEKDNVIDWLDTYELFKFWSLQEKGLITKRDMEQVAERSLLLNLIEWCANNNYSKQVAKIWSHETNLSEKDYTKYCITLGVFEGNYRAYSNYFSGKKEILSCVSYIKESDLLRVFYIFSRNDLLFEKFKKESVSWEKEKLSYEEMINKMYHITNFRDKTKEELELLFKQQYNYIPKIMDYIVSYCDAREIKPIEFIKYFNGKQLQKLLKIYHIYTALDFMYNCFSNNLIGLSERVVQALANAQILTKETLIWLESHKKLQEDFLIEIISYNIIKDINMTPKQARCIIDIKEATLEMQEIENKYKNLHFKFKNFRSGITDCTVEAGDITAYVLKDERIAILGKLTCCCQRLGHAGESAMMYGLFSPNAGFWACEKSGKIFAQAEVWTGNLNHELVLVFDNIELANDRSISDVEEILRLWCKKSCYTDIIMGCGYNELIDYDKYSVVKGKLYQPKCKNVPDPYTDTDNECVWLKEKGKIMF